MLEFQFSFEGAEFEGAKFLILFDYFVDFLWFTSFNCSLLRNKCHPKKLHFLQLCTTLVAWFCNKGFTNVFSYLVWIWFSPLYCFIIYLNINTCHVTGSYVAVCLFMIWAVKPFVCNWYGKYNLVVFYKHGVI